MQQSQRSNEPSEQSPQAQQPSLRVLDDDDLSLVVGGSGPGTGWADFVSAGPGAGW